MANIKELLLFTLNELKTEDLELFQWYLKNGVEGFTRIQQAELEKSTRHDTVDKMVEIHHPDGAVEITLVILEKMNLNQQAEDLGTKYSGCRHEESNPADGGKYDISMKMKIKYKEKFEKLYEEASLECDLVPLKDTYTEVYVTRGCTGGVDTKHEVRQVEDFYAKIEERPIKLSDLFKLHSTENTRGTKVLTVGIAGVGKTVSVHKFILDWAEEKCNQDLDFIMYLPFRELNLIKDEEYSISELLLYFHQELSSGDLKEILREKPKCFYDT